MFKRSIRAAGAALCLALSPLSLFPLASAPAAAAARSGDRAPETQRISRPDRRSLEYRLSWGLASIKADRAYRRGLDGRGVTVAMIDAGMTPDALKLFAHLSPSSTDLIARQNAVSEDSHARQTATLLSAPLDGEGTLGVAYGADLLSVRIDADGSCVQQCFAYADDLARGIDYAVANGAKVIAIPMVGTKRLKRAEPAIARAAAAGALIVAAAGNDGGPEASWPARYATDPRLRDAVVVVGASTMAGEPAKWSNKAGSAADRYILAPGENLLVDCDRRTCRLVSGTSYSVPYVAGAISLVMTANPALSAQQAAKILLASASDRAQSGVDATAGRGLLDVRRALQLAQG